MRVFPWFALSGLLLISLAPRSLYGQVDSLRRAAEETPTQLAR